MPTNLRVLTGNAGKRPINREEPRPAPSAGKPPSWLGREARRFWPRLYAKVSAMRVMTSSDEDALAMLCQELATYVACARDLAKRGATYTMTTKAGDVIEMPRPQVAMRDRAFANAVKLMDRFGLDPAYRSRLKAEPEQELDPLEELRRRAQARKRPG